MSLLHNLTQKQSKLLKSHGIKPQFFSSLIEVCQIYGKFHTTIGTTEQGIQAILEVMAQNIKKYELYGVVYSCSTSEIIFYNGALLELVVGE